MFRSVSLFSLVFVASLLLFHPSLRAVYTEADADRIFDAFNQAFYQSQFNNRAYYRENTDGGRAWFWGQANMIEMAADAYDRSPSLLLAEEPHMFIRLRTAVSGG